MNAPQQPGIPYAPPPAAGQRRTPLVIALSVVLGAALATTAFLLLSHKSPAPAPVAAAAAVTTEVTTPVVDTTPAIPLQQQVDIVVSDDGVPLQLDQDMYADAYAMIQDDCSTMVSPASGQDASEWLAAHLLNASVPGEAAALRLGIPLVCPQFSADLLQVAGN